MKTTKYIIATLAGVVTLASCVKEAGKELPAPEDLITIKAQLPEDATTKAGAHVGFSWLWSEGDKIAVSNGEDTQVYNIKQGFSAKMAEFVGKPVEGESFTIAYPTDAATADWSKQTQKGNNSYAHLKYAAQLSDVDDYLSFAFDPDWAAEHKGTLKQIGVMKMTIELPDTVTAVKGVSIAAEDAIFFKGNGDEKVKKLELAVEDAVPDAKHTFVAWFTTSWNEVTVPENTVLTVSVKTKGTAIEKEVTFTKEAVLMAGMVNTFDVDKTGWVLPSHYAAGKGTAEKPWIIMTAEQISYMYDDMADGETRYFKLGADIDMKDITDWKPLNAPSPYNKAVDFDGDGHTISNFSCNSTTYPSFFGVLNGKCYNVKFVNAEIVSPANQACGIIGGYAGTGAIHAEVSNVHVQGKVTLTGNKTGVGGMFGILGNADLFACSADCEVISEKNYVGGLFGYDSGTAGTVTVRNCWTSGSVSGNQRVGGICGGLTRDNTVVSNCYSTSAVTAAFCFGGIAGHVNQDKGDAMTTRMPGDVFEKCIAWNNSLKAKVQTAGDKSHYSDAAIVGFTATHNYLTDCVRKPDIDYLSYSDLFSMYDQENASPEVPLVVTTVEGAGYNYPYHGKAAGATETLSQVAQRIGWSAEVWDFSGDTPKLK